MDLCANDFVPTWLQELLLIGSLFSAQHFTITPTRDFTIAAVQIQTNRVSMRPVHFLHSQCDAHQRDKSASDRTRRGEDSAL